MTKSAINVSKLEAVRKELKDLHIDGLLVTNAENRRYLTDFTGSAGVVFITKTDAKLLTDFRYDKQATEQVKDYDVEIHGQSQSLIRHLVQQVQDLGIQKLGFEAEGLTFYFYDQLQEQLDVQLVPTTKVVEKLRMIKTEDEIEKLRTAAAIADSAFKSILDFIQPGVTELDVANELEYHMRKEGATSNSSKLIVASGHRGSLPHGVASEKVIEKGDMITFDFGALYQGYRSDMTRTIAVGEPDPQLKEIYGIVLEALLRCTKSIEPEMPAKEVDATVRNYITEQGYGENFGHGAGHGIGLFIHEDPFFSTTSNQTVKENMVVTIEPGIYIPDFGGVRIEDDVVVKKAGNEILTKTPRDLIVL